MVELGPRIWQRADQVGASMHFETVSEEVLGPRGRVYFDGFMQKLFDTIWNNTALSNVSAVRAVMIMTASRCEARLNFWADDMNDISGLAKHMQIYVEERESLRAGRRKVRPLARSRHQRNLASEPWATH